MYYGYIPFHNGQVYILGSSVARREIPDLHVIAQELGLSQSSKAVWSRHI